MKKLSIRNIIIAVVAVVVVLGVAFGSFLAFRSVGANAATPQVDTFKAHPIVAKPRMSKTANPNASGQFTCQNEGAPFVCFGPWQMRTAYGVQSLIDKGKDGSGTTIVIIDAFSSPTIRQDLAAFDKVFHLRDPKLNIIAPQGSLPFDPKDANMEGWAGEITLDVEWAHAMAPGATITLVLARTNEDVDILKATKYAVDHNLGDVISQSFGEDESCVDPKLLKAQHEIFEAASKKGITIFASTGDQGAAQPTCDNTSFSKAASSPAVDPLVTAVGGTQLFANTSTGAYKKEVTWNEVATFGAATGGGYSKIYKRPSYQDGVVGSNWRGEPDVAMNAAINHGVLVAFQGSFFLFGGTSASTPEFAGLVAIADQINHGRLGNINPKLYSIGKSQNYGAAFHDVTVGNNTFAFADAGGTVHVIKGFSAGKGWDAVTGWGSLNAAVLLPLLAN